LKPIMLASSSFALYYAVVRRIPRGRVATYSQVALLAGRPRAARQVGFALAALRGTFHRVPWQRVLAKRSARLARIAILDPMGAAAQRDLLEREGVAIDERGQVGLERFGWRPRVPRGTGVRRGRRPRERRGDRGPARGRAGPRPDGPKLFGSGDLEVMEGMISMTRRSRRRTMTWALHDRR